MINLAEAIAIAAEAHKGQTDKHNKPYILHCLAVMRGVDKYDDEELSVIAVLHDLIEDTMWQLHKEPDSYWIMLERIRGIEVSERVYKALVLLTHTVQESYDSYIRLLSSNPDAIRVKLSDLTHNSLITRLKGTTDKDIARVAKYHKAYLFLSSKL